MSVDDHGVDAVESSQHPRVHHQHVAVRKAIAELGGEALTTQPSRSRDCGEHDIGKRTRVARDRDCDGTESRAIPARHALRVSFDNPVGQRAAVGTVDRRREARAARAGMQAQARGVPTPRGAPSPLGATDAMAWRRRRGRPDPGRALQQRSRRDDARLDTTADVRARGAPAAGCRAREVRRRSRSGVAEAAPPVRRDPRSVPTASAPSSTAPHHSGSVSPG